ncbi:MAG: bifunctional glutamate N-acetyltransferase/amino-acid acetyltransferase ArgJ [Aquificota bacterium]
MGSKVYFATATAGIKPSGKKDLLVVYFDQPTLISAVYTKNHFKAAPVIYSQSLTEKYTHFRALVINSGNANCGTGEEGLIHAQQMAQRVAQNLNLKPQEVLVFSTGIIGVPLPIEKVLKGIDQACQNLRPLPCEEKGETCLTALKEAAEAISTTDRFPKYAVEANSWGFGKGAGMIHPNMATMLAYVFTEAKLEFEDLRKIHQEINEKTFNSITVDGCTSTNDSFLLIALGNKEIPLREVKEKTFKVAQSIAKQIVADGEGATKVGIIEVVGAKTKEKARAVAEKIATSLLVKTALFGCDPNWGRIIAAAGSAFDYPIDPNRTEVYIGKYLLFKEGKPTNQNLQEVAEYMKQNKEILIKVNLNEGKESWRYLTSDLTYDYVKLNAEYTT